LFYFFSSTGSCVANLCGYNVYQSLEAVFGAHSSCANQSHNFWEVVCLPQVANFHPFFEIQVFYNFLINNMAGMKLKKILPDAMNITASIIGCIMEAGRGANASYLAHLS
jgi:hypothetical protein